MRFVCVCGGGGGGGGGGWGWWWGVTVMVAFTDILYNSVIGTGRISWWRHQMETFSALLALCAGNSPFNGEFLAQRPVTRSFDIFFDLRMNKQLSKQSWGLWLERSARSFWQTIKSLVI